MDAVGVHRVLSMFKLVDLWVYLKASCGELAHKV
jgi:hypothetical protein